MNTKSYIVDLVDPAQLADAYDSYLRHSGFLLRTEDDLNLLENIRVRFTLANKGRLDVLAQVVSQLPHQGYGLQLPDSPEVALLIRRGQEASHRVRHTPEAVREESATIARERSGSAPPPPSTVDRIQSPRGRTMDPGMTHPVNRGVEVIPVFQALRTQHHMQTSQIQASDIHDAPKVQEITAELPGASGGSSRKNQPPPFTLGQRTAPLELSDNERDQQSSGSSKTSREELAHRINQLDRWVERHGSANTLQASPKEEELQELSTPSVEPIPDGAALRDRLLGLKTAQKRRLAISGSETERRILIQDSDKDTHVWVLKNPDLDVQEAIDYASLETLAEEALRFLLGNPRWTTNSPVICSLVKNRMVPPQYIPRLLTILDNETLHQVLTDDTYPALVHGQSRRILVQRDDL